MRMSTTVLRRNLDGVDPASVSGNVTFKGINYPYKGGHLTVAGQKLMISDDHYAIIDAGKRLFGVVVNGAIIPASQLPPAARAAVVMKYKV